MDTELKLIYNTAIALLARRDHTALELQQKLLARYPEAINQIIQTITRLTQDGYQSDRRFAEAYFQSRQQKGYGIVRILQELQMKGIDKRQAQEWLGEHVSALDQSSTIKRAWQKKFRAPPNNPAEKNRQIRYLLYRGFAMTEIQEFLKRI